MSTVIVYNVLNKNGDLERRSFVIDESIKDAKVALIAAKSNYNKEGKVLLQGYFEVTDEELSKGNIVRIAGE